MTLSSMQEDMKAIRIIAFSGNDWDEWSEKFYALATDRGYGYVITECVLQFNPQDIARSISKRVQRSMTIHKWFSFLIG